MAITYPLNLPTNKGIAEITVRANTATSVSQSPFTFQEQVQVYPGQQWSATIKLPPMKRDDAAEWSAFLLSLNGREGTFLLQDPSMALPRGIATGTPVVNGLSQTGNMLSIKDATPNVTGWLRKFDHFHMVVSGAYRLHAILEDVNTDSSGEATFAIWPRLRESPPDETSLVLINPVGQFRLQTPYTERTARIGNIHEQSFACAEAI